MKRVTFWKSNYMTKIIVIFVMSLFIVACNDDDTSDPPGTFLKFFGGPLNDEGLCIRNVSTNGYIICGKTTGENQNRELYIIRADDHGRELWSMRYSNEKEINGNSVLETEDGGFIICGTESQKVFVLRVDQNGKYMWYKSYPSDHNAFAYEIIHAEDNGFIICGHTYRYDKSEAFLIKIGSDGEKIWEQIYNDEDYTAARSVDHANDGGYICTGTLRDASDKCFIYVFKTDVQGNLEWSSTYGDPSSSGDYDYQAFSGQCIRKTLDNGYIVCAYNNHHGGGSIFLVKIDSLGTILWDRGIGGDDIYPTECLPTKDGGYIVTGDDFWGALYFKLDSQGHIEWFKHLTEGDPSNTEANSVQELPNQGYVICGTYESYNDRNYDVFLLKTDADGNYEYE